MRRSPQLAVLAAALILLLGGIAPLDAQSPPGDTAGRTDAYVVPFSHLDLFWAGTREECLARGNRVIAKAIRIARQYPAFRFFLESNNFVANFVDSHAASPELADFKRFVKEGRFGIAPNWADIFHNLPDGEVHARNFLYGKRYAQAVFGVDPHVFHPGDIPGFTLQFPQMLVQSGVPFMVMTRMGPADRSLFNWRSPDGSKILVWNALRGYAWGVGLNLHGDLTASGRDKIQSELQEVRRTAPGPELYVPWGVDLWAPTEKLVSNVDSLNRDQSSAHFVLATPQEFFNRVRRTDVSTLAGEIPMAWPHVVDGIVHLWQLAVPATNTLTSAEKFAAINYAAGFADYPQQDFEVLWKSLIESMDHNHDGQGGEIGDTRKMDDSLLVLNRGGEILRAMLRNIAERVQIPIRNSFPIVVFNSLNWQRDDVITAHVTLYGDVSPAAIADYKKAIKLVDENGTPVPFHVDEISENISRALQLTFVARAVPSVGYKTYYLTPADETQAFPSAAQVVLDREKDLKDPRRPLGSDVMENEFYRVTVDRATGAVALFDKQLVRDVVKDAQIEGVEERGTNNVQREIETGRTVPFSVTDTRLEQNDGVRAVLRLSGWMADIPLVQRLVLYQGLKRFDIENSLDWKEQRLLRIEQLVPLGRSQVEVQYGIPFGANSVRDILPGSGPRAGDEIQKDAWEKYRTIQSWIFAGDAGWGVTMAADHQLVKLADGLIRAGMIRGQRYTSARVVRGGDVTSIHFPAPGHYVFRYSISSGPGDWKTARAYQTGMNLNAPLIPVSVVDEISPKSLSPTQSVLSVQAQNLVVTALKKAEAGPSIILRLYEIEGAHAETPVTFLNKPQLLRESNLLEENAAPDAQRVLRVNPYEIKTVKLQPGG